MFPSSVHAVDKFHLFQEMNKQVDKIRIRVMNSKRVSPNIDKSNLSKQELYEISEKEKQYYILKKFSWIIFKNDESEFDPNREKKYNHKLECFCNLYDIREKMMECSPELAEAYILKDDFVTFYKTSEYDNVKYRLNNLIKDFECSSISEIVHFSNTLKRWKKEIINSFIPVEKSGVSTTINNGLIENRNKTIKDIKHNSNGYSNWERFRSRVLYCMNKDATYYMYPTDKKGNRL